MTRIKGFTDKWLLESGRNLAGVKHPVKSKYKAKPVIINGKRYASTKEGKYALELSTRERFGEVSQIQEQVTFSIEINEIHCFNYILDFSFYDHIKQTWRYVDVKGYKAGAAYQMFKLKKKCVEAKFNIIIEEI